MHCAVAILLFLLASTTGFGQPQEQEDSESAPSAHLLVDITSRGEISLILSVFHTDSIQSGDLLSRHFQCPKEDLWSGSAKCKLAAPIPADGQPHELSFGPMYAELLALGVKDVTIHCGARQSIRVSASNWQDLHGSLRFKSLKSTAPPSPLLIQLPHINGSVLSLLAIPGVPILIALCLRTWGSGNVAWLHLLINATWMLWIYYFDPSLVLQPTGNPWLDFLVITATSSLPPLISICIVIRLLNPIKESMLFVLLTNAQTMLPIAIVISSLRSGGRLWIAGLLVGYLTMQILAALLQRVSRAQIREIVAGEWFDQIQQLGASAGVKLQRLLLHRSAASAAVNAFAIPGDVVMLSEDLVDQMPTRERNSVVAHELAHLRHRDGIVQMLFWGGFWVVQSLASGLLPDALQPFFFPLGLLAFSQLSQFHEFRADAFAAKLTGDPEATIAALGRLAEMTGSGLRWNPLAALLISHPSMERRALSLARRFQIPPDRALEILRQPEAVQDSVSPQVKLPLVDQPTHQTIDSVFTRPETELFARQIGWIRDGVILSLFAGAAWAATDWPFGPPSLIGSWMIFLLAPPVVAALANRAADFWEFRQYARWERELRQTLQPPPGSRFVALRPGSQIRSLNGFLDWDVGFLSLSSNQLSYFGQRTRFDLPASAIWQAERHSAWFLWSRLDAVHIQSSVGSFSLRDPLAHDGWKSLLAQVDQWWSQSDSGPADREGPSLFPQLEPPTMVFSLILHIGWKLLKLTAFAVILIQISGLPLIASWPVMLAPIAWLIAALPDLWRELFGKWTRTRFAPRQPARGPVAAGLNQFGNSSSAEVLN